MVPCCGPFFVTQSGMIAGRWKVRFWGLAFTGSFLSLGLMAAQASTSIELGAEKRQILQTRNHAEAVAAAEKSCRDLLTEDARKALISGWRGAGWLDRVSSHFPWEISRYGSEIGELSIRCARLSFRGEYSVREGRKSLSEVAPVTAAVLGVLTVGSSLVVDAANPKEGEFLLHSRAIATCDEVRSAREIRLLEEMRACEQEVKPQVRWYQSYRDAFISRRINRISAHCRQIFSVAEEQRRAGLLKPTVLDLKSPASCRAVEESSSIADAESCRQ